MWAEEVAGYCSHSTIERARRAAGVHEITQVTVLITGQEFGRELLVSIC